jgi:hypothetical protein
MVNIGLPRATHARSAQPAIANSREKPRIRCVNEFLSKRLEFSENTARILIEYAQKREQPLQSCLLACVMRRHDRRRQPTRERRRRNRTGYGTGVMFFLLRVAFWLIVVLALLPTGRSQPDSHRVQVGAGDAVVAAGAAVSDVSGFCDRQPEACHVGGQAAVAIGQRAQEGAKMVYDFINDRMTRGETGSLPERKSTPTRPVPAFAGSQTTLTAPDLEPQWQGPNLHTEAVPLPRKNPRRGA